MSALLMRRLRGFSLAALLAAAACERAGPSTPTAPSGPPPRIDISGAWTGTKVITWNSSDEGDWCEHEIAATFTQVGARVTGTIADTAIGSCQPAIVRFTGHVQDSSVILHFDGFESFQPAAGRVIDDRLDLAWFNVTWFLRR